MLQEKILEDARPYLEGRVVTDLVLGIALIGAQLDGENVGVSYMLRDSLPSGCGSFSFAARPSARTPTRWQGSWSTAPTTLSAAWALPCSMRRATESRSCSALMMPRLPSA